MPNLSEQPKRVTKTTREPTQLCSSSSLAKQLRSFLNQNVNFHLWNLRSASWVKVNLEHCVRAVWRPPSQKCDHIKCYLKCQTPGESHRFSDLANHCYQKWHRHMESGHFHPLFLPLHIPWWEVWHYSMCMWHLMSVATVTWLNRLMTPSGIIKILPFLQQRACTPLGTNSFGYWKPFSSLEC